MDENMKRLEALRRAKKRRKQIDITIVLAVLAVLFLLAGIRLGQGIYFIVFIACALFTALMIFDLRREKRRQQEQDAQEQQNAEQE